MKRTFLAAFFGLLFLGIVPPDGRAGERATGEAKQMRHIRPGDSIRDLVNHPAFTGFGHLLLPRDNDRVDMPLSRVGSLLPYHSHVSPAVVAAAINHMIDEVVAGETIFYDFYTEQQKQADPAKASTGLFFFRGKPGAPFALICPGGGFSYVGSLHEGFPHAQQLSRKGYNAFVLRYRVGGGGAPATEDLSAAVSYIFRNAGQLEVDTEDYSLWGSSAGARMVAYVGTHGVKAFGGDNLPCPAIIVMAYTGHSDFSKNDPPTFVTVSVDDPIANASVVEKRVMNMRNAGIDVEFHKFKNAGHGFGIGTGTDAEGWMEHAVRFWEKHMKE